MKPLRLTRLFDSCACSLVRANGDANVWLIAKPNRNATEIKAILVAIFPIYKSFVAVETTLLMRTRSVHHHQGDDAAKSQYGFTVML